MQFIATTDNNAYYDLNRLSEEYILDSSNMKFSYGGTVKINEPGKYLLLTYISGVRDGNGFSYWISDSGYPTISSPSNNSYKKKGALADSNGLTTYAFILDIKDLNGASFTQSYHPGSVGGKRYGWTNQIIKLEKY